MIYIYISCNVRTCWKSGILPRIPKCWQRARYPEVENPTHCWKWQDHTELRFLFLNIDQCSDFPWRISHWVLTGGKVSTIRMVYRCLHSFSDQKCKVLCIIDKFSCFHTPLLSPLPCVGPMRTTGSCLSTYNTWCTIWVRPKTTTVPLL